MKQAVGEALPRSSVEAPIFQSPFLAEQLFIAVFTCSSHNSAEVASHSVKNGYSPVLASQNNTIFLVKEQARNDLWPISSHSKVRIDLFGDSRKDCLDSKRNIKDIFFPSRQCYCELRFVGTSTITFQPKGSTFSLILVALFCYGQ